jgi:ubiquinone/menaquinone biosynthesis C-methylase UbiE
VTIYDRSNVALGYARFRHPDEAVVGLLHKLGRIDDSSHVLEVGCGTANYVRALHHRSNCLATGIDPSEQMLAVARREAPTLHFFRGAAEALPLSNSDFDLVFSVDVIHHVEDKGSAIAEAFRVLRSGAGSAW